MRFGIEVKDGCRVSLRKLTAGVLNPDRHNPQKKSGLNFISCFNAVNFNGMEWRNYLSEAGQEFIALHDLFMAKFVSGEIKNDENGQRFLLQLKDMGVKLRQTAETAMLDARKEKEKLAAQEVHCPKCNMMLKAKIIGEAMNSLKQRVYRYQCMKAHTFNDFMPIDDDEKIAWYDNFIEQLFKKRADGTTHAEKLNIPESEFADLKNKRDTLATAIQKEKAAIKAVEESKRKADEALRKVNELLIKTYGELLTDKRTGKELMN